MGTCICTTTPGRRIGTHFTLCPAGEPRRLTTAQQLLDLRWHADAVVNCFENRALGELAKAVDLLKAAADRSRIVTKR